MFKFGSKKDLHIDYKCTIRLLDDNEALQCDFQYEHKGQFLLDFCCNSLNLVEKDYFGLRYVDAHKQRHWLDPTRSIVKQVKGVDPIVFCFRIKFYPAEPHLLKEEITRYQIFLQLRRDLLHGRLYCSQSDSALLGAYIVQSEFGDYDETEHVGNYLSDFKLLLKQTPVLEDKIMEIHQGQLKIRLCRGQVPGVAEASFLRKACLLDTYGVDPHPVKDHKGTQLYLGINHAGILTFQGSRKTHHFRWADIQKINYEGKMFIIHLLFSEDSRSKKKHLIGFKCPTHAACQHLWRCAVEQRYFFTLNSGSEVPAVTTGGGLLSRGSKFRYSGRTEKEIYEDLKTCLREPPPFQRSLSRPTSFRYKSELQPLTSSKEAISEEVDSANPTTQRSPQSNDHTLDSKLEQDEAASPMSSDSAKDEETQQDNKTSEPLPPSFESIVSANDNSPRSRKPPTPNHANTAPLSSWGEDSETLTKMDEFSNHHSANHIGDVKVLRCQTARLYPAAAHKGFHVYLARLVVLASLFVLLLLTCLLVVVMESDSALFSDVRKLPRVIVLRREYYEPARDYLLDNMNAVFK